MKRYGLTYKSRLEALGETHTPDIDDQPKTAEAAVNELIARGYNVSVSKLKKLVERGPIAMEGKGRARWDRDRIEQAAEYFEEQGDFLPLAAFLEQQGLTMEDHHKALMSAHKQAAKEYGMAAYAVLTHRPDADDFVLHIAPPRGNRKASIWFTLQDDVERKIRKRAKQ